MKRLGGIVLPEQAQWVNRYSESRIIASVRYTTGGVPIFQEAALQGGTSIVIEFTDGVEWIDESGVKQIKQLENQIGITHELEWEGEILRVVFNRQMPSNFAQVWPGAVWYTGQINLIKI